MAEKKTLVGDDSRIYTGDLGATEYVGDNTATISALVAAVTGADAAGHIMCVITAKAAAASTFPDGLNAGELFPARGTEVLKVGDKFKLLSLSHVADAASWSLSITQAEIDVTRLNDRFRKYRLGKKDAQLSLSSIFTTGESDAAGGVINRNMKLVTQAAAGTFTVNDEANKALYMLGFANKAALPGEVDDFVFCQIYLYNVTLGGQSGSAQSYDASGRLTGLDPIFYSLEPAPAA
jgi:hypothetical protein